MEGRVKKRERLENRKGKGEDGVGNGDRQKTRGEPEQNKKGKREEQGGRKSILKWRVTESKRRGEHNLSGWSSPGLDPMPMVTTTTRAPGRPSSTVRGFQSVCQGCCAWCGWDGIGLDWIQQPALLLPGPGRYATST